MLAGNSPGLCDPRRGPDRPRRCFQGPRSEEHTSELQSLRHLVCRLLLEKKKKKTKIVFDGTSVNCLTFKNGQEVVVCPLMTTTTRYMLGDVLLTEMSKIKVMSTLQCNRQ